MNASDHMLPGWLEQAWLARYLDRELSPEETEWFEAYMLDKPHLLRSVEEDNDLRDGLHLQAPVPAGSHERDPDESAPPTGITRRRRATLWFARAAALLVSATGGWWAATSVGPVGGSAAGEGVVADPVRIVFDTQRGVEDAPLVINAGSKSRWMLVEVGVPWDATDVHLLVEGASPQRLTVTSEGFVTFLWPRSAEGLPVVLSYSSAGKEVARTLRPGHGVWERTD